MGSRYVVPINMKFGTGKRRSAPRAKFNIYRGRNVGVQPPKLSKFRILAINLPLRGHSFSQFYEILRFCTHLQVDFKFLLWLLTGYKQPSYKHFPAVGAFSLKFSTVPSGKTTDRIKKVRGCKNGTNLLYHHAKYGGDRGLRAGCRRKSVIFLFVFSFFVTLWNQEVCDNGNAMKQWNFQNNYGTIA